MDNRNLKGEAWALIRRKGLARRRVAYQLRQRGWTFKRIGVVLGVSGERARQMESRYARTLELVRFRQTLRGVP